MAGAYLEPVVAVLAGDMTAYEAMLAGAQERMDAFVLAQTATLGELDARFAALGAGAAVGADVGGAINSGAVVSADAEITSANEAATASTFTLRDAMAEVAASAEVMAVQTAQAYGEMEAKTAAVAAGMDEMAARAAAANARVGEAMDANAAKSTVSGAAVMSAFGKVGIGAGIASAATLKMAGDFQTSTNRLVTSAGETAANLDTVRDGILSMAGEVGYSAEALSTAIYKIDGAGFHAADSLNILKASAQGAKAENADLTKVSDALSTALVDYHRPASDAADVMSKMVAATASGKMTFEEMAGSLNSILPVASAAKISFDDVMGSLAAMTVHGMSADQAAQNMADAVRHLQTAAQSATQSKALATLGLDANDVSQRLGERGLSGTLQLISDRIKNFMPPGSDKVILDLGTALNGTSQKVQNLADKLLNGTVTQKEYSAQAKLLTPIEAEQASKFANLVGQYHQLGETQMSGQAVMSTYAGMMRAATGDATGLKVALMLAGDNADIANGAIKNVAGATADASGNVQGWSDIQSTFNQKLSEAKDGVEALAIKIGETLLPIASKIASGIGEATHWLADHKVAAEALAYVLGGALVVGLTAATVAMVDFTIATLGNPITWIVLAIVAWVAALIYLATHWDKVKVKIAEFRDKVLAWIDEIWHKFLDWIGSIATSIRDFFTSLPGKVWDWLVGLGETLLRTAANAWNEFMGALDRGAHAVLDWFRDLPHRIAYALGELAGTLLTIAYNAMKEFIHGAEQVMTDIANFFISLPGKIKDWVVDAGTWLRDSGKQTMVGYLRGLYDAYVDVYDFFHQLPNKIHSLAQDSADWIHGDGKNLLVGFYNGMVERYNDVVAWFHDLPNKLKGMASDAGNWLVETGRNIIRGVINGIRDMANHLLGEIYSLANDISNGFNAALHIHSPSLVFAESGMYIAQGLAQGIQAHRALAVDAAQEMAARVVNTMTGLQSSAAFQLTAASPLDGLGRGLQVPAPAGSGPAVQVIVNVAGSVHSVASLKAAVQDSVLKHAFRNISNGLGSGGLVRT